MNIKNLQPNIYKLKLNSGISLFLTIAILSSVFAIGLGVVGLLITEIKITRDIMNFIPAIYAADSGTERALYKIRKAGEFGFGTCTLSDSCIINGTVSNGAVYTVSIVDNGVGTCIATTQCIKSIGSLQDTNRAFEVTY